ncbi:MAG: hypothetical protein HY236_08915 [Acidobacteria bacterium]|nr:hypothetical protein [Acidobacteriota bacterium]
MAAFLVLVAPALRAQTGATYFLIVGGLGGEPDYEQRFAAYVKDLEQICRSAAGDPARVTTLSGKTATKQAIQAALDSLARATTPADSLAVFLIGHGTFDGTTYKFNIPGPDVTGEELRGLLDRIPAGRQLVVNATSSSGVCAEVLARENRIVVTATRSGTERNATVFARYWVEALRDPAADADKNESISALEAFRYAEEKVKRFYADQKRLATEHPRLEGKLAASFVLARLGSAAVAATDPARRKMLARREGLEQQIDALKYKKSALPAEQYKKELERLLLELARVEDAIEAAGGKQTTP